MEYKISNEYDGKQRKLFLKVCEVCKNDFWVPKYRLNILFSCSRDCGKIRKNRLSQKENINCAHCNALLTRTASKKKRSKLGLYFCNRICKEKVQKVGGLLSLPHYKDGKSNYRKIVNLNSKCVDCGESRLYLLKVHHINGDKTFNEESNLEIVCSNCHDRRHLHLVDGVWVYSTKVLTPRDKLSEL